LEDSIQVSKGARTFSERVLQWFDVHGRKDLPWQKNPTAYRVWVSEVMLQQTRVSTVIPYYEQFMQAFPDVITLADATLDEVLHLWSGLGYYGRARNLHKAAQVIRDEYAGKFPGDMENVCELPGIGQSTAGAILALSSGQRHAILDGNVKRVLSRYHAVEGWPGRSDVMRTLWTYAEQHTPDNRLAEYTQAMMDLGATICTRSRPACDTCPLQENCQAFASDLTRVLPSPKPRKNLPVRQTTMLMLCNQKGEVLLQQRPPAGVWGGLWSFPEIEDRQQLLSTCTQQYGCKVQKEKIWQTLRHTFSHFHLDITPIEVSVKADNVSIMEQSGLVWYNSATSGQRGMAAPVKRLLETLESEI
jgi:A/G-specific adenine glycosylase